MSMPNIEKWLDNSGLNRHQFRLLGHISRRAGRYGKCNETVSNMAGRCGMSERTAQYCLPMLLKAEYTQMKRVATPNSSAHYALTSRMHVGDEDLVALFVPAWLDEAGLTPEGFRLFYHYLRWSWDGEVEANHARATRTCGKGLSSYESVLKAESELCKFGLLRPRGRSGNHSVFAFNAPQEPTGRLVCPTKVTPKVELSKRCTPTVKIVHPDRWNDAPKGLTEGLAKSSSDDVQKSLDTEKQRADKKIENSRSLPETFFKNLLGREYEGFTKFVANKCGDVSQTLSRWCDEWGEERLRQAWKFLMASTTPWTEKHGERLGPLYGLFDTLHGNFYKGQPQRLCALWVEVKEEMLEKKRAAVPHFSEGDIVRVGGGEEEYEVASSEGINTFFTDDTYALSSKCTFIRRKLLTGVTEDDLIPVFIRLKRKARENLESGEMAA